jgi:hypothetical protein
MDNIQQLTHLFVELFTLEFEVQENSEIIVFTYFLQVLQHCLLMRFESNYDSSVVSSVSTYNLISSSAATK